MTELDLRRCIAVPPLRVKRFVAGGIGRDLLSDRLKEAEGLGLKVGRPATVSDWRNQTVPEAVGLFTGGRGIRVEHVVAHNPDAEADDDGVFERRDVGAQGFDGRQLRHLHGLQRLAKSGGTLVRRQGGGER